MTQADSVLSTPPTNTSANNPPEGPEKPQDSLYLPTEISPEEVFQAIGRLRKEARDEIDRLIGFLDKTDDYVSRELEDSIDDNPMDDDELDGPENGEDEESDPAEPSLGSLGCNSEWSNQESWARSNTKDLEDEHDGAEPDDTGGDGAIEDDEASLGWPERMNQTLHAGSSTGMDNELQDHATVLPKQDRTTVLPKQDRTKLPKTIDVEVRGYSGRVVIRNLTDGQQKAMAEKMDR